MKFNKIYSALACAVAVLGFASCSDVTDPVMQKPDPAKFEIYTPPFQNEYFELTDAGTFEMSFNEQPSYGFSAVTQYRVDVCLDDKFEEGKYETLTPTGTGTLLNLTLRERDLAAALTAFQGIEDEKDYVDQGEQVVYFRGRAFIENAPGSEVVTHNVVTLNRVQSYFYIPKPGVLYLIGNYQGAWIPPMPENIDDLLKYALMEREDQVGSKIYYGTVDFQNNAPVFRFYSELGSWDENSWGVDHQGAEETSDNAQEFEEFTGAEGSEFEHKMTKTKDSFSFPKCPGGVLDFVVDMREAKPTLTITPHVDEE